ncbi:MAG: 16S rRNA (guanine(527)-N(7))-methyltransferase RsmG [Calditrichaeota bacterium]|nr:16S rRNA (guanine(527)-N(7))-methyltransferase RsmG [Calditrichota bacterium]
MLDKYRKSIIIGNKNLNLVSGKNVKNLISKLIYDSLLPLSWDVCQLRSPLIDIGAGAGIPGIPILIAKPEIEGILLDSNRRKTLFLKKLIESLNLEGIDVICARAENIVADDSMRNHFNTLVSRAAASMSDLLSWGDSLLKPDGELIAWKGSSLNDELTGHDFSGWSVPDILHCKGGLTLVRFVKL